MGYLTYVISLLALFLTLILGALHGLGQLVLPSDVVVAMLYSLFGLALMAQISTGKLRCGALEAIANCPAWAIVLFFALILFDFALLSGHGGRMGLDEFARPHNRAVAFGLLSSGCYSTACIGYSNQ